MNRAGQTRLLAAAENPDPDGAVTADDVAALLCGKGIDRAVIVGLAMGGFVAMAFCRRHADHVLGLVLANTRASADSPEWAARRRAMAERIDAAEESVDVLTEKVLPQLVGPTTFRQRALV